MADDDQGALFEVEDFAVWRNEWIGMPEFVQEDLSPFNSVVVHFDTRKDMEAFSKLMEQTLTMKTQSIWYPKAPIGRMSDKRYADES